MSVKTSPPSRARPRAAAEHPSGDPRFSLIDRTLKRFSFQQDALIEVLHTAQEAFGFLSDDLLIYVAHQLKLPLSWVYGVATFYHFFTLTPQGQHNCIVCMGTACYVKRAAEIVAALQQEYQVMAGETTSDGRLSLSTARCLGSCGLAPVLVLDGEVLARETPETTIERVRRHLSDHAGQGAEKSSKNGADGKTLSGGGTNGGIHEPI
ncbi:MAG: bidirectional hydrogenase complex protein HoxE [Caldilinea sp.]|jgi:bidirectional [NiFe] hydrogenase diaphorase subunit